MVRKKESSEGCKGFCDNHISNQSVILEMRDLLSRIDERTEEQGRQIESMGIKLSYVNIDSISALIDKVESQERQINFWRGALFILASVFGVLGLTIAKKIGLL